MTEQRLQSEDYELLRLSEFDFQERMRYIEEERNRLYTTEHNLEILKEIEGEAIATRRSVYVALGLEDPDTENDILI